jgi:hypothetical protein
MLRIRLCKAIWLMARSGEVATSSKSKNGMETWRADDGAVLT